MSGKFDRRRHHNDGGRVDRHCRTRENEIDEATESRHVQDEQSLRVLKMFEVFQRELDGRYDKVERITKKSRDITIESKRIIFLLHRISKEEVKDSILEDASHRLREVCNTNFKTIAMELQGEDPFQFLRSFSPGLQEFIEAALYYKFLKDNRILTLPEIQEQLIFNKEKPESTACDEASSVTLLIPYTEYILGIGDFTGELMRKCINSIGLGNQKVPFDCLPFLREILEGFLSIGNSGSREMSSKLHTLRQSVQKVENACYAIVVRKTEVPDYKLPGIVLMHSCDTDTGSQDRADYGAEIF